MAREGVAQLRWTEEGRVVEEVKETRGHIHKTVPKNFIFSTIRKTKAYLYSLGVLNPIEKVFIAE